jgi:NAD+ kinase
MSKIFATIGLIGRQGMKDVSDTLIAVFDYLQSHHYEVLVEEETTHCFKNRQLTSAKRDQLAQKVDLLIVVGGDGSLINAAHSAVKHNTPVLGVNRGRLGFLTDIHPQDLEKKIGEVLSGNYQEEKRFLLNATITVQLDKQQAGIALNEVVLTPGNVARMIEFSIMIDDQFVCAQQADGLIVATPTGSTAYALSGGGPILYPQLEAIVLVPMFPHTLSARPIVVSAKSRIVIHVDTHSMAAPWLSCDGQERISVPVGANISIQKNAKSLRLIHPLDYNYFETLRSKLHWHKHNHSPFN